jgi:predicted acetyltransferase
MAAVIRTIDPSETAAWLASLRTSFLASWPVDALAQDVRTHWDYDRVWAAVEDDHIVGTARSWATELTVPGGAQLPGTAIAAVSVLPTHRRRGLLRRLMDADLTAAHARGESLAVLWASQAAIYGRFGFGAATRTATWTVGAGPGVVPGEARPGALEVVTPSAAARDIIREVFEAWRARQPGEIRRRPFTWDDTLGLRPSARGDAWSGTLVVHHTPEGDPDGYVRSHLEERWERHRGVGVLHVDELHALSDEAYRDLWRLVCGMEWAASVRAEQRSPHERLPWLVADGRTAQPESVSDGLWLALLDLPAALEARSYRETGRLVIGVARPAPGAASRVLLDATPEGATCRATDDAPDLVVSGSALAAAYLGGVSLRDATIGEGVDEHRPGALVLLDGLLRTLDPPWCSTFF